MYRILADERLFCSSKVEELSILNPVINLEANKAGTFKFVIPPNHPYYDNIQRKTTLVDVYRDDDAEPLFEGICVAVEVDFYKQKTIECEGELTFLNDSNLRPAYRQGMTSRQLLEAYIAEHNSLVEANKRFTVGQVTAHDSNDYITCFTNYQSTMTEIKEDLIDDIGGYLRTRHVDGVRYLDYLAESPRTNNQIIRLGENLLDLTQSLDTADLATVIIPLGATLEEQQIEGLDTRLDITGARSNIMHPEGKDYVYSRSAVNRFGWIEKVVTWDDVTVADNLLAKGEKYLQETQWENLIITAKAIDLGLTDKEFQKFRILDMIRVKSDPHGLDRYFMLTRMTINLNNPENDTITLGIEEPKTLSAKTSSENEAIKREIDQKPTSNAVKQAIDNATALITGANGGYVVIEYDEEGHPVEIKIQDAINNPTKIWRWNQNGFGYSSDGGNTYGLAMTMDGSIVADFISSGTMTSERVRGGEFLVGGSGIASDGSIKVEDANNNVIATLNKNGLDVRKGLIKGTSIQIGGLSNADGTLTVYDSVGNAVVTLNTNGITIKNGTIEGTYIKLGGTQSGAIDVKNSNDARVAYLDEYGLRFFNPQTGNIASQITPNNIIVDDENGDVWVQMNKDELALFNGRTTGTNVVFWATRERITLNSEYLSVGTNSGRTFRAVTNEGPFILPKQLSNDGRVLSAVQGVLFVNGMMVY